MKVNQEDTPPSSINGDEISGMDEEGEGLIYLDEMEEVQLEDLMDADLMEDYSEREPPEDHATLVFNKHVGSVFCCNFHPDGKLAVTGGEDDKAYVWSVETGQVLMQCNFHKDSVIFAEFSSDGAYLATGDMSGMIKVWKCNTEENQEQPWPVVFEYEVDDLTLGLWHFGAKVLIVGTVTGDIFIFKIPSGETKVLQGSNIRVECAKMFPDGVRLAAGYEDGAIKIWDLKTSQAVHTIPANIHQMRVTDLDTHHENNLVASISTDGKVVLTTSVNGKVVGQIDTENDMEVVTFAKDPQLDYFALGTLNGSVSIWDLTRQMVRHQCSKSSDENVAGVTKMLWIKNHLVTAGLDGAIIVYEGRSGEKCLELTGHQSELLDMCYNAKQNILLTSSEDGTARIFKYELNKEND
ncbi:angio-associated migratory cell protein [Ostrinia nubilalis]|uniref:angio-associated migratory cell protein n=1 Tax=Ostrinia nubilalis TaxID=29057 RepID=UPI0030822D9C